MFKRSRKRERKLRLRGNHILKYVATITTAVTIISVYTLHFLISSMASASNTDVSFEVNVKEALSVAITTPSSWAEGTPVDNNGSWSTDFLRNSVTVEVAANGSTGFTASMYSADNTTSLKNTSKASETLSTLDGQYTKSAFPLNKWGYSLGEYTLNGVAQNSYTLNGNSYGETIEGNGASKYYPLVSDSSSPIIIMDGATTPKSYGTQNIYFGAKAGLAQASGTYTGTVIINVVTGVIDSTTNPVTPVNPATDNDPSSTNPTYADNYGTNGNSGWTVFTSTSSGTDTETTTTQVSEGDNRSVYDGYADPHGVVESTASNISNNTPLATGLAATASAAAATGLFFFIVAKRREDDEEEDEQL